MPQRTFTLQETINGLTNAADGVLPTMAAVQLLIAHNERYNGWLQDTDFQRHLNDSHYNGKLYLNINWPGLIDHIDESGTTKSSSAVHVLCIAASLYDSRCPITLNTAFNGFDHTNQALVLNAIATAMGSSTTLPVPS